ncbi:MAG: tRNA (guanine37-N1)-methyltransferase [Parcubacteria group bacterium Greene0714_36]|nr:MAG: tRNA (guanine37-N1)-methyltransferase [Parcubacteria group bacterium Greene0714_36]
MRFDVVTIFPAMLDSYLDESILRRAREKKLVEFRTHNLRDFSRDLHKKVDDKPYGGGPGMVMQVAPLAAALQKIVQKKKKHLIVLFSAAGRQFDAKMAAQWAKKYEQIVMIAGRYEGVDSRIKKIYKMQEISIGPFVLTGGALPTMVIADAVSRHILGVLGNDESLEERRHGVGMSVYTRPEVFKWKKKRYRVPKILLSGDHKKIDRWRQGKRKVGNTA